MKTSTPAPHQDLTRSPPASAPDQPLGSPLAPPLAADSPSPPAIRRASGGLRFLGALLLFSTLNLLSCQSLFIF
jgi:hypothetical protein